MFTLHATPLDPVALKAALGDQGCGAFVCFEGWVRNHNEGKQVHRLDYEAYAAVALAEGNRIVAEACQRFGVPRAHCAHRVGSLALGDLAVWVGVATAHRGEAFAACRYIIDAIKHRVPIWKKEFYTSGDSGWVNCEHCAAAGAALDAVTPAEYYARQMRLPEVGTTGQGRLGEARVLVVGAGGLGCGALPALVAAGVGTIGICDADSVALSNLHRQTLYTVAMVGQSKAACAVAQLGALNPLVRLIAHETHLTRENAAALLDAYDLVLDCTDNFETKHLLNDLAVRWGKRLVQASIYQYEGQLFAYAPGQYGGCLRCLWPEIPDPGCVGACADVGVLGVVPAAFGALQAAEALKMLLDLPDRLDGDMLFFDLLRYRARRVPVPQRADCPVCGTHAATHERPVEAPVEVELDHIEDAGAAGWTLVDIRESYEAASTPLSGLPHMVWPASQVEAGETPLVPGPRYLLVCARGRRSKYLALRLRREGIAAWSLKGGLDAILTAPRHG